MTFKLARMPGVTTPALTGITAGDLLDKKFAPREYAVAPWLRTGETALIWAPTGVGKTWMTLSLAIAIAGGGSVWEWKAPKPRKVMLIDGEMNQQDLQGRIATLVSSGAVTGVDTEALRANLSIVARQAQDPESEFFDITSADSHAHLMATMDANGTEVVIVDNITTCADGLRDENDSVAFRPIMVFLMRIKQAGKVGIIVHHANKSGQDFRGSTALEATFEVKLGLLPAMGPVGKASFNTVFGKFRGKGDGSVQKRQWTLGDFGWTVVDPDDGGEQDEVLLALKSLKFKTQNEIAKHLMCVKSSVSKRITKLEAKGHLKTGEAQSYLAKANQLYRDDFTSGDLDEDADDTVDDAQDPIAAAATGTMTEDEHKLANAAWVAAAE